MIVLLVATPAEAAPLLAELRAEPVPDQPYATWWFAARGSRPGGLVIVSGMGAAAAGAATRHAIANRGATVIVNPGICGALTAAIPPATICSIDSVSDGDAVASGATPPALLLAATHWPQLRRARLASVTQPVFGGERRTRLAAVADAVDMEGFAIAAACREVGIPCHLLKGASDLADDAGRKELHRNLPRVSALVAEAVVSGLATLTRNEAGLARRLANFVKVEHTIFSLPLLLAGAWLGAGGEWPPLRVLLLIALAGLGARTLGMAMNRILDRRLDLLNPRTAGRELPGGRMSPFQAWSVAGGGLLVYLLACAALGPLCLLLSPIPAAALIGYSYLKRFTGLCHFGIGLCLMLGPLGAFVAASGGFAFTPSIRWLALFTFCWISGFDIIYALQDLASDRATGVRSLPALLGSRGAQALAGLTHLVAAGAITGLWWQGGGGLAAGIFLAVCLIAFGLAYWPALPLPARFFPTSAIAGVAGAIIPLLGGPV